MNKLERDIADTGKIDEEVKKDINLFTAYKNAISDLLMHLKNKSKENKYNKDI